MIDLLQTLGSGILVGLVYALLGLCIVIIFKASEAFNFAIGEFLIIGSFLFYVLFFNDTLPWHKALPSGGADIFILLVYFGIRQASSPAHCDSAGVCGRHANLFYIFFRSQSSLSDRQSDPALRYCPSPGVAGRGNCGGRGGKIYHQTPAGTLTHRHDHRHPGVGFFPAGLHPADLGVTLLFIFSRPAGYHA